MSKSDIQVGDRVTLIDKPWEHEVWARFGRKRRKDYIDSAGKIYIVKTIWSADDTECVHELSGLPCAHVGLKPVVPLCLLRKVEQTTLTWVEPDRERMKNKPHPKIKKGTKFIIVDEKYRTDIKAGEIVTLWLNDDSAAPIFQKQDGKNAVLSWHRLAPLTPAKHRYTPEQEAEAREIVYRLMTRRPDRAYRFRSYQNDSRRTYATEYTVEQGYIVSENNNYTRCSPNDEWSDDIGRMVAISRLLGEPLPEWIRGDRS